MSKRSRNKRASVSGAIQRVWSFKRVNSSSLSGGGIPMGNLPADVTGVAVGTSREGIRFSSGGEGAKEGNIC